MSREVRRQVQGEELGVSAVRRRHMAAHARRLTRWRVPLDARAPWLAPLVGARLRPGALAHHPPDDLCDRGRGAQLFLHAHDRATHAFVHVHCFMRVPAAKRASRETLLTHLVAIGLDRRGWPCRLLATNQWVTGDWWQPARPTLALVDHFDFGARTAQGAAGRALASILHVFYPELKLLLARRDARLQRALDRHPRRNVLGDRRIEVVAAVPVDLPARLSILTREQE